MADSTLPALSRNWWCRLLGVLVAVTSLVPIGMSPMPPPAYVEDQVLVEFFQPPTDVEMETFAVKYKLALHRRVSGVTATYLFEILDGSGAKLKQRFVADDPSVCRVSLNWLGEFHSTGPERPFGRCEGDEVGLPSESPPDPRPTEPGSEPGGAGTPGVAAPASADALPAQPSSGQPDADAAGRVDGAGWIASAIVVLGVIGTALIAGRTLRLRIGTRDHRHH